VIPLSWLLVAGAAAGLAAGGFYAGARWVRADWDAERAAEAQEAVNEQHHRVVRLQEIQDANHAQVVAIAADARRADARAASLRGQLAEIRRAHPPAAGGGTPAGDAIGVLADVLEQADERLRVLARVADERGAAGLACERAYDSMTTRSSP
jgi:hypothetical protein